MFGPMIPGLDDAFEIFAKNGVYRILDDRGKTEDSFVVGLFALGDVHEDNHQPLTSTVLGPVGHDAAQPPLALGARNLFFTQNQLMQGLLGIVEEVRVIEAELDVAEGTANVRGDEMEQSGGSRCEQLDAKISIEENSGHVRAIEQIGNIVICRLQLF